MGELVIQKIMDKAYNKWEGNESMREWFEELTPIERKAVAIGKLHQQVNNGGFFQWDDNGYSFQMFTILSTLNKMKQTPEIIKLKSILHRFERLKDEGFDDDEYDYWYPKLDELDNEYYKIGDKLLRQYESYFKSLMKKR